MTSLSFLHLENIKESIISSNTNTSKIKKQHRKKYFLPPSGNPLQEFECLPDLELKAMRIMVWFSNNKNSIHFTQSWLAKQLNIARPTANKVLGSLADRGYISWVYRHMKSCIYTLSDYFLFMPIRNQLSHLIKAFKYVSLSVITASILHAETISKLKVTRVSSPLDYYIYLAKRNSHILCNQETCIRIGAKDFVFFSEKNKKSEQNMNNPPTNPILDFLNLTQLGYARLAPFPQKAFEWSAAKIRYKKELKDPFIYFQKLCKIYCNEHRLSPDWSLYQSYVSYYKLDPMGPLTNGPLLRSKLPLVDTLSTTPSNFPKREGRKTGSLPKNRRFLHDMMTDEEIIAQHIAERKSWVQSLPSQTEEVMRSMAAFFPGTPQGMEEFIVKHSKEGIAKRETEAYTNAQKEQAIKKEDKPKQKHSTYTNEDSLKQMIWGMVI